MKDTVIKLKAMLNMRKHLFSALRQDLQSVLRRNAWLEDENAALRKQVKELQEWWTHQDADLHWIKRQLDQEPPRKITQRIVQATKHEVIRTSNKVRSS